PGDLERLTYDTKTQWPDAGKMPAGFDPQQQLIEGMDPGLGLRQLQQQGITGKGIRVAMIDKYILPDHVELAGHIKYTLVDPLNVAGSTPHFHGMATASILAGSNLGVAPDAFLYYYAVPDWRPDGFTNYVKALEQIVQMNSTLPMAERIRVVSVSWAPDANKEPDTARKWDDLVAQAKTQGTAVVYAHETPVAAFGTAGVLPGRDRNDPNAYEWADWVLRGNGDRTRLNKSSLGVPASFRTTASVAGPKEYAYWGDSGQSWAIPYFAGLVTLGLQVNPDMSLDDLYVALERTAEPNAQGIRMVNPAAFIAAVRR
ncbi:MAG: S8/S53 family peptidase, partial [Mycobacterium leprae]